MAGTDDVVITIILSPFLIYRMKNKSFR